MKNILIIATLLVALSLMISSSWAAPVATLDNNVTSPTQQGDGTMREEVTNPSPPAQEQPLTPQKGEKGDPGATGATGNSGDPGATGVPGTNGGRGPRGLTGPAGKGKDAPVHDNAGIYSSMVNGDPKNPKDHGWNIASGSYVDAKDTDLDAKTLKSANDHTDSEVDKLKKQIPPKKPADDTVTTERRNAMSGWEIFWMIILSVIVLAIAGSILNPNTRQLVGRIMANWTSAVNLILNRRTNMLAPTPPPATGSSVIRGFAIHRDENGLVEGFEQWEPATPVVTQIASYARGVVITTPGQPGAYIHEMTPQAGGVQVTTNLANAPAAIDPNKGP